VKGIKGYWKLLVLAWTLPILYVAIPLVLQDRERVLRAPVGAASHSNEVPVGELADGVEVIQPVVLEGSLVNREFSIGVLFATFERDNSGKVVFGLRQGERFQQRVLKSDKLKDNTWYYLDVPASYFLEGEAEVMLTGIGGNYGSSPTAWAYHEKGSEELTINGSASGLALCMRHAVIEGRVESPFEVLQVFKALGRSQLVFWSVFGFLISLLLVYCKGGVEFVKTSRSNPDEERGWRVCLSVFLGIFLVKVWLLSWNMFPLWEISDETGHYSYIVELNEDHRFPVLGESVMAPFVAESMGIGGAPEGNWIAQHPPLYYLVMSPVYQLGKAMGWSDDTMVHGLRMASGVFAVVLLGLLYHLLRLVDVRAMGAFGAVLLLGSLPMFCSSAVGVSHDLFLSMLCVAACLFWVLFWRHGEARWFLMACACMGLANITKYTALVISPIWFAGALIIWRAEFKRRVILGLIGGFIVFTPIVAWCLRNWFVYHEILPVQEATAYSEPLKMGYLAFLEHFRVLQTQYSNFICLLGWIGIPGDGASRLLPLPGLLRPFYGIVFLAFASLGLCAVWSRVKHCFTKRVAWMLLLGGVLLVVPLNPILVSNDWLFRYGVLMVLISILMTVVYAGWSFKQGKRDLVLLHLVSWGVFLVFLWVLTHKMYDNTLVSGFLRAAHGRYFFPLIGFLAIGFVAPALKQLDRSRWVMGSIVCLFWVLEWLIWLGYLPLFMVR